MPAISSPSNCLAPADVPPRKAPPFDDSAVQWCVLPPPGYDPAKDTKLRKSDSPEAKEKDFASPCLDIPAGERITRTYCQVRDAYGSAWCSDIDGPAACDYWAWPKHGNPRVAVVLGKTQACTTFFNESHNRKRRFQFFAE